MRVQSAPFEKNRALVVLVVILITIAVYVWCHQGAVVVLCGADTIGSCTVTILWGDEYCSMIEVLT